MLDRRTIAQKWYDYIIKNGGMLPESKKKQWELILDTRQSYQRGDKRIWNFIDGSVLYHGQYELRVK